jgi:A/G-specific adenine glycosylase
MNQFNGFQQRLLAWFDTNGRKHLPWQLQRSAYHVWLSEIMLQQTQVATVIPYFERFIKRFPTIEALASASDDEVMQHWAGLGYYARARNLHACAKLVCEHNEGVFPDRVELLEQLPGIGRSTAGAIVAQAYHRRAVILDGNVKRVLCRYRMIAGWPGKVAVQKSLWALADRLTPAQRVADYTQAIMDLGAMVCRRSRPLCEQCPLQDDCHAFRHGVMEQFPEKKVRAPIPTREAYVMLCYRPATRPLILLEKRPPSGIWGGLWSLPQCEPVQVPESVLGSKYGCGGKIVEEAEPVMHTFTHYRLHIRPLMIELDDERPAVAEPSINWCDAESYANYGMPRPIEKLIRRFFESQSSMSAQ